MNPSQPADFNLSATVEIAERQVPRIETRKILCLQVDLTPEEAAGLRDVSGSATGGTGTPTKRALRRIAEALEPVVTSGYPNYPDIVSPLKLKTRR